MQMAEMSKAKVTPRAKHPEHTQLLATTVKEALDAFEEEISLLDEDVCFRSERTENYLKPTSMLWNLCGTWPIWQTLILF